MSTIVLFLEYGFLLVLLLGIVALVSTAVYHLLILRVPFVPTPRSVARRMVAMADLQGRETVIDLGAGTGTIIREAKRQHPGLTAIGYEIVPTIWALGRLANGITGVHVDLRCQNVLIADVRKADVVFLYMTPALMAQLEEKFERELRPGSIVLSHGFRFPHKHPLEEITVPGGRSTARILKYRW